MLQFDADKLLKRIPYFNHDLKMKLILCDAMLAGGALRGCFGKNEVIVDYDIFFKDPPNMGPKLEQMLVNDGYEVTFRCPKSTIVSLKKYDEKVQLILEWSYPTPDNLLDSFDFNACRVAYYNEYIITDRKAIRDIRKKRLTFHKITYPNIAFKRIQKYIEKGYSLPNETIDFFVQDIYNKGKTKQKISGKFYITQGTGP